MIQQSYTGTAAAAATHREHILAAIKEAAVEDPRAHKIFSDIYTDTSRHEGITAQRVAAAVHCKETAPRTLSRTRKREAAAAAAAAAAA